MRVPLALLALLVVGPIMAGCLVDDPAPDTAADWILFENGVVWTADEAMPWAGAVAVAEDRIIGVAGDAEALLARFDGEPERIDLEGRLLLPGFHDTHNHFVREAGIRDASTWETNPYEPWAPGYDPVTGPVGQNRVAVGHIGRWAEGNVDRILMGETPAPPSDVHGNEYDDGHDHGHGMTDMGPWPREMNDEATWHETLQVALATANKYGVTSSTEAGATRAAFDVLRSFDDKGGLTARFNLYFFPEDLDGLVADGWTTGHGDDRVRVLGLKVYTDGWLGPRTAALREMFEDRPHKGFAFYTQDEVDAFVAKAHANGLKVTAHAIGDRATEMMLTAYERASAAGCPDGVDHPVCDDPRFTIEHASIIGDDLLQRMVDVGLVPSIQMSFATSDAPWIEDAVGEARAAHAYRWKTFLEEGMVVGGSSDWPIEVLPPLWGVERAVTRTDLNGVPEGGFHPEEALTVDEALRLITINAAHLEFRDHELGSITEGKLADLVVLGRDIFQVPADTIADTTVELTMVDGRVVHTAGAFAGLEVSASSPSRV